MVNKFLYCTISKLFQTLCEALYFCTVLFLAYLVHIWPKSDLNLCTNSSHKTIWAQATCRKLITPHVKKNWIDANIRFRFWQFLPLSCTRLNFVDSIDSKHLLSVQLCIKKWECAKHAFEVHVDTSSTRIPSMQVLSQIFCRTTYRTRPCSRGTVIGLL